MDIHGQTYNQMTRQPSKVGLGKFIYLLFYLLNKDITTFPALHNKSITGYIFADNLQYYK